jgi:hypothetical protein
VIARWKGIVEEIHFGGSIMPLTIIENLDLEKPSFGPSKWPRKLKPAKNSKLPKWPENCFEPFGKGGWPPISTWIKDQKVRAPLQNIVMDEDEDDFQEEEEDNIHCVGDDAGKSYLKQHDYEEALMKEQINENFVDNGVFLTNDGNKYNLRSKSNTAK